MTFHKFVMLREGLLKPDAPRQVNLLPAIQRRSRLAPPRPRPLFPMPKPASLDLRIPKPPKLPTPPTPPGPPG